MIPPIAEPTASRPYMPGYGIAASGRGAAAVVVGARSA